MKPVEPNERARGTENTVLAVERALKLVDWLAGATGGLSLAELAQRLTVNKAIAARLLETLEKSGYVWRDDVAQRYHLTYRVSNLGLRQLQHSGLLGQSTAVLKTLAERTGELVRLAVVEAGQRITWVHAVPGARRAVRIDPSFNFDISLHSHATGKAWLMTLGADRVDDLLRSQGMPALTAFTCIDRDALQAELDAARRRGFALTYQENELGVGAVAAPIRARRLTGPRECVGAVSVAAPTACLSRDDIEACGPLAVEAAARLELIWPLDESVSARAWPGVQLPG